MAALPATAKHTTSTGRATAAGAPATAVTPLSADLLQHLLSLTRQMVTSAKANDWDRVALLDNERLTLLRASPVSGASDYTAGAPGSEGISKARLSDVTIDASAELISADDEILRLAREQRDRLGGEGIRLQAQRSARNQYANAQRLR